jgi:AsmA-like C-terminal region
VDWGDRWNLAANLELTGIDLDGMTQRFTQQISLTGRLDAKLAINAQGASMASLFAAPRVEGEFVLANGALSNVDLMKAIIEAPNYDKVRGGQTVFKKFSGSAVLAEQRLSLKQMSMVSGSLTAGGVIDVMPDNTIAGKINLELGSAESNPVKDTVALTGNLKEPVMKPSK